MASERKQKTFRLWQLFYILKIRKEVLEYSAVLILFFTINSLPLSLLFLKFYIRSQRIVTHLLLTAISVLDSYCCYFLCSLQFPYPKNNLKMGKSWYLRGHQLPQTREPELSHMGWQFKPFLGSPGTLRNFLLSVLGESIILNALI